MLLEHPHPGSLDKQRQKGRYYVVEDPGSTPLDIGKGSHTGHPYNFRDLGNFHSNLVIFYEVKKTAIV
jgi:hypothetical protein